MVMGWGCSKCGREEKSSPQVAEEDRRKVRNCDETSNPNLVRPWAGRLARCPWSMDDGVWVCIGWWQDWREFQMLPYGGSDLSEQPAYVVEAIQHCQRYYSEAQADFAPKPPKPPKGKRPSGGT